MNDVAEQLLPPAAVAHRIEFAGARRNFFRLLMHGALLELATLGFYRFWLATDMRRHMWSHTSAGGDTFEYTGTAKELLIGFLFALAILIPIYLVYFFVGIEAERYQVLASIPLVLFFYLFAQFAFYRARRYRVTRTIWRGVRFWMTGSGWAYAIRAFFWMALVVMTLGLALPWYQAVIERYKMRHTFYGELQGRFDGSGWQLFKRFFWLWLAMLPFIALVIIVPTGIAVPYLVLYASPLFDPRIAGSIFVISLIAWPFVYAMYKASEWRWWINGIRLGGVRFESGLRAGALIGLYWKVIGCAFLILLVFGGWFAALGVVLAPDAQGQVSPDTVAMVLQRPYVLIALAVGYVAAALAFGAVSRLYLRRDVWVRVVSTIVVHNLAAAENVTAGGEAAGALGEGLSDSLDVGGF